MIALCFIQQTKYKGKEGSKLYRFGYCTLDLKSKANRINKILPLSGPIATVIL